jgi:hypothetical protein
MDNVKIAKELVKLAKDVISSDEQCPYSVGQEISATGTVYGNSITGMIDVDDMSKKLVRFVVKIPFVGSDEAKRDLKKKFFDQYKVKHPEATDSEIKQVYKSLPKQSLDKFVEAHHSKMQSKLCEGIESDWKTLLGSHKGESVSFKGRVSEIQESDILMTNAFYKWEVFVDII